MNTAEQKGGVTGRDTILPRSVARTGLYWRRPPSTPPWQMPRSKMPTEAASHDSSSAPFFPEQQRVRHTARRQIHARTAHRVIPMRRGMLFHALMSLRAGTTRSIQAPTRDSGEMPRLGKGRVFLLPYPPAHLCAIRCRAELTGERRAPAPALHLLDTGRVKGRPIGMKSKRVFALPLFRKAAERQSARQPGEYPTRFFALRRWRGGDARLRVHGKCRTAQAPE
jgi:hypothetical protein